MTSLKARLAKARARLFGTAARDVPVPFELPCDCGHRVTGIRRPSYQVAVCSACQSAFYVLPVNVYPATRRVRSEVVGGPVVARVGTVVRELIIGEKAPEVKSSDSDSRSAAPTSIQAVEVSETRAEDEGNRRRRQKSSSRTSTSNVAKDVVEPIIEQSGAGTPLVRLPRMSLARRLKKTFSPTRLLALAGVAILVATGWWMIRQQQLEEARKVWRQEMDLAETAIRDNDLVALQSALKKAVAASRILNRSDPESREAKSLLRQTESVQNLSSTDLVSLLSGIVQKDGTLSFADAKKISESVTGQHLVFEALLKVKSGKSTIPELDLPLIVAGIPLRILVPSGVLLKCSQSDPSLPLLFIAAVNSCQPPSDPSGEWQIALNADSCTLITTELHAKKVGYNANDLARVRRILERQAEFVKSNTESRNDDTIVAD